MDSIKKNILSILCGVVALLAVVSIWFVWNPQVVDLKKRLDTRKQTYDKITALTTKQRHLPIVSDKPDATAAPLDRFPNDKVMDEGVKAVEKVQKQSTELRTLALNMNVHKPLVPGVLPNAAEPFTFQAAYTKEIETGIRDALNAATPPTDEQIRAEEDKEEKRIRDQAPHNEVTHELLESEEQLKDEIDRMQQDLPKKMRTEAATRHKMYMAPAALSSHSGMPPGGASPDATQVWYAQMMLWAEQDVRDAIIVLNSQSQDVAHSPVKQLVGLAIEQNENMYVMPQAAPNPNAAPTDSRGGAAIVSSVAQNSETDAIPKDYSTTPTGRVCNGIYDVVHITLVLTVQAPDVARVIKELEKGRLLTVYQVNAQSVNSVEMQKLGYFFGQVPVVTLSMECEELFLRDAPTGDGKKLRDLMPLPVKQYLNIQDTPATPGATASTY